ncbi:unnamed protein product, partial [Dicrocoelium dendriticum]
YQLSMSFRIAWNNASHPQPTHPDHVRRKIAAIHTCLTFMSSFFGVVWRVPC